MSSFQDASKEAVEKGQAIIADLADKAGVLSVKAKIKAQQIDQSLEYDSLMKKLGEAVYEEVKLDERYTNAHPELFAQIAEVIERRQALDKEYARVSEQAAQANQTEQTEETEQPEETTE